MAVGARFKYWSQRFLAPDKVLKNTYEAFKDLLASDISCHELMAEFEELYYEGRLEDFAAIRLRYRKLGEGVEQMLGALERMQPGRTSLLREYLQKYDFYIQMLLAPPECFLIPPYALTHNVLHDASLVGLKSHNLLKIKLEKVAKTPPGFTIPASTAAVLLAHNQIRPAIDLLLASMDPASEKSVQETSDTIMTLVRRMEIPALVQEAIFEEFDRFASALPDEAQILLAVRSSALQEDGRHSFAGQYHSELSVRRDDLLAAYLKVLASKYSPESLLYRIHAGFADEETGMAVLVLLMLEAVASGVAYSHVFSAENGTEQLLVQSVSGLGLPLVQGEVSPDVFVFKKATAEKPIQVQAGRQEVRLVVQNGALATMPVPEDERGRPILSEAEAALVAETANRLEAFFQEPQDVEWVLDATGELYVVQSRPLTGDTVEPPFTQQEEDEQSAVELPQALLAGAVCASRGVCTGQICRVADLADTKDGQFVLVTSQTPPSLVRYLDRLVGVVCEQGATTGHFATVCREFGIVLLVGAEGAMDQLSTGKEVTLDGFGGRVFSGRVEALLAGLVQENQINPKNAAYRKRIRRLLDFITPLHLTDPESSDFKAQSCKSLHDIIRYSHETAIRLMFGLTDLASGSSSKSRKLRSNLPLEVYLLDVDGGFAATVGTGADIGTGDICCVPFLALWQGLSHPEIDWDAHAHFDWKGFADMSLADGIASGGVEGYGSYAVVSRDYVNFNMRFGFHFAIIDCLCGPDERANYCQLRFAGGGGDFSGRSVRLTLLQAILSRLGFLVQVKADLLDARLEGLSAPTLKTMLVQVGRLFGMTKLLDMVVTEDDVPIFTEQFFAGKGYFVPAKKEQDSPHV